MPAQRSTNTFSPDAAGVLPTIAQARRILVSSLDTTMGKTTFCRALTTVLRRRGITACCFKPMGGTLLFGYLSDVLHESIERGLIYGHDSLLHSQTIDGAVPPELLAPCYVLNGPDFELTGIRHSGDSIYAVRGTVWEDGEAVTTLGLDDVAMRRAGLDRWLSKLQGAGHRTLPINGGTLPEFRRLAQRSVESVYAELERRFDVIIVESYDDVAVPWIGATDFDPVIVLGRGVAGVYPGPAFMDVFGSLNSTQRRDPAATPLPFADLFPTVTSGEVVAELTPARREQVAQCSTAELEPEFERVAIGLLEG